MARARRAAGRAAQIRQAVAAARRALNAGEAQRADAIAGQVLAADPINLDALHIRGIALHAMGRPEDAIATLRRVVGLDPAHAMALADLGGLVHRRGHHREALGHLTAAVEAAPKLAAAHFNLGNLYSDMGELAGAETAFRTAIRYGPDMVEAHLRLSAIQIALGFGEKAVRAAEKAVRLSPGQARTHTALAMARDRAGDLEGAIRAHEKAIGLSPDAAQARLGLARTLAQHGRLAAAIAAYRDVVARHPEHAAAYAGLGRLVTYEDPADPDIAAMETIKSRKGLSTASRRVVGFALGKAYEDCGAYEKAFAAFTEGNEAARASIVHDRGRTEQRFADVRAAFSDWPDHLAAAGSGARPIFVLGMPRSGTTLVEQILSRHSGARGAGELTAMRASARRLGPSLSEAMRGATPGRIRELSDHYQDQTRGLVAEGERLIDKSPANFLAIGLIRLMFPDASIVYCRRGPADTALSIYKTNFANGAVNYSFDVRDLAHYYRHHLDLMDFWMARLSDSIHTIDYETLVADQGRETRRLLAYCDLAWEDDVLAFHRPGGAVHTASMGQVRQPIHTRSAGIAQRYGEAAVPLMEALAAEGVPPTS